MPGGIFKDGIMKQLQLNNTKEQIKNYQRALKMLDDSKLALAIKDCPFSIGDIVPIPRNANYWDSSEILTGSTKGQIISIIPGRSFNHRPFYNLVVHPLQPCGNISVTVKTIKNVDQIMVIEETFGLHPDREERRKKLQEQIINRPKVAAGYDFEITRRANLTLKPEQDN